MSGARIVVVIATLFALVGCADGGEPPVMPDLVGSQLDTSYTALRPLGVTEDDVEIVGGGLFGIVDESNWQVCDQSPMPGEGVVPTVQLTVSRSCDDEVEPTEGDEVEPTEVESAPTELEPTPSPTTTPSEVAAPPLTVETSSDLRELLEEPDNCSDEMATFAETYQGMAIEFDGTIVALNNHGDYETRYDFLVYPGDYSETSVRGPSFQLRDVSFYDLHITDDSVDTVQVGDAVHLVAEVIEFEVHSCLFLLDPISTEVR